MSELSYLFYFINVLLILILLKIPKLKCIFVHTAWNNTIHVKRGQVWQSKTISLTTSVYLNIIQFWTDIINTKNLTDHFWEETCSPTKGDHFYNFMDPNSFFFFFKYVSIKTEIIQKIQLAKLSFILTNIFKFKQK